MKRIITKLKSLWGRGLWRNKKDPQFMDINPEQASLKKVVYWRVVSTIISMVIAYYYLNEISTSIEMTIVEAGILTVIHYVFEELWSK
tara:strand:+ start:901 stop:1164 length:264 start_codon:yes stop_codon:yes gene_type:complete